MARSTLALAALALLALAAIAAPAVVLAGGGCHGDDGGSAYMEADGTTVIRMDTCSFAPTVSRVATGTTVRFLNTATLQHQVVGRSGTWGSVLLEPGQEHGETFEAAGVYPYTCPLHPGMVGAIVVGDASVPADGSVGPVDLTSTAQPTDPSPPTTDPVPLAAAGLAGLAVGLGIGGVIARPRRRTAG